MSSHMCAQTPQVAAAAAGSLLLSPCLIDVPHTQLLPASASVSLAGACALLLSVMIIDSAAGGEAAGEIVMVAYGTVATQRTMQGE